MEYKYIFLSSLLDMLPKIRMERIKNQILSLMTNLSPCYDMDMEKFTQICKKINENGCCIVCYKGNIEVVGGFIIVGMGTVFIEHKFNRGGSCVGHIEDIVTHAEHRKKGIATNIVNRLVQWCELNNCYKVVLDARAEARSVYEKCGFVENDMQMVRRII